LTGPVLDTPTFIPEPLPMWIFTIITMLAAITALTLSVLQLVNRHRPFVGISHGTLTIVDNMSRFELTLNNWGEIPAKAITVDITLIQDQPEQGTSASAPTQYIESLFPVQAAPIVLLFRHPSPVISLGGPSRAIIADISYNYWLGRDSTVQYLAITGTEMKVITDKSVIDIMKQAAREIDTQR